MKFHMALAAVLLCMTATAQAHTRVNPNRSADLLNQQVLDVITPRAAAPLPTPPAPPPAPPSPPAMTLTGIYMGGNLGTNFQDNTDYTLGAVLGYQVSPVIAVELTYDYQRLGNNTVFQDGQMVMANVLYGRRLGVTSVTPYALAGAGVGWNGLGERDTGDNLALYNVGGGVRINLVSNIDVDARYRYVGAFNTNGDGNAHVVSGGLNIRF